MTLGLLCGGQGRRLGGPKESLVDSSGRTLLEYQVARLGPHFSEVLLLKGAADKVLPVSMGGLRALADPTGYEGHGPMAGLLSALAGCRTEWLALMPVDCPYFPADAFAEALSRAVPSHKALGFLDHQSVFQWLPGLYHRDLRGSLEQALAAADRRFGHWVKSVDRTFLPWTHAQVSVELAFTNVNTPELAMAAGFHLP